MVKVYELYNKMEEDKIILSFKGDITQDLLNSVFNIIETHLDQSSDDPKRKKKFYLIVVECLQNLYHHIDEVDKVSYDSANNEKTGIFMIGYDSEDRLQLITGNQIKNSKKDELKKSIDEVNSMDKEELRKHYREKLSNTELSEKGGAGLGLIDIARKSGHKLQYSFDHIDNDHTFFSLVVTV